MRCSSLGAWYFSQSKKATLQIHTYIEYTIYLMNANARIKQLACHVTAAPDIYVQPPPNALKNAFAEVLTPPCIDFLCKLEMEFRDAVDQVFICYK